MGIFIRLRQIHDTLSLRWYSCALRPPLRSYLFQSCKRALLGYRTFRHYKAGKYLTV